MNSKVLVIKTKPEKIIDDYASIVVNKHGNVHKNGVIVKLNLSWTKYYPACSSPPWQFEGVLKGLIDLGYKPKNIYPVENKTVVTDVYQGAINHYWTDVAKKYGVKIKYLTEEIYFNYRPKAKMLVLDKIFPQGIFLPEIIKDKPLVSLCTLKTHVFTKTTGSIKNYFGMLTTRRHWAHRFIHEAIIDLLQIQKEFHPSLLGVMDGTVTGFGSGPRAMNWKESDLILASCDEVALDSVAAKIIGFDPLKMEYLSLGKKLGLGENDTQKIAIEGIKELPNLHLSQNDNFASRGQKLIYKKLPWSAEKLLLQSFIAPWSYLASKIYYDVFWFNIYGKIRKNSFMKSTWGRILKEYEQKRY